MLMKVRGYGDKGNIVGRGLGLTYLIIQRQNQAF